MAVAIQWLEYRESLESADDRSRTLALAREAK